MLIPFLKMVAAGNDFVVLDLRDRPRGGLPELAQRLCARHFGVGSDGLLVIERADDGAPGMRMFNPDGTEDFCGNGLRCVAVLVAEGAQRPEVLLRSPFGLHRARVERQSESDFVVEGEILPPEFAPERIPVRLAGERVMDHPVTVASMPLRISCVGVGTTHTLIWQDRLPDDALFQRISPALETHDLFPERTSVLWCVAENRRRVHMRIWERGAGETLACGTGACAAAAVGRTLGLTEDRIEVITRGGSMTAEWPGAGAARLTGPARIVFTGTCTDE